MSMNNHKNKNVNKHLGHEEENKDLCDTCYDRWENFNHKEEKKKEHGHEHGHEHNHPQNMNKKKERNMDMNMEKKKKLKIKSTNQIINKKYFIILFF